MDPFIDNTLNEFGTDDPLTRIISHLLAEPTYTHVGPLYLSPNANSEFYDDLVTLNPSMFWHEHFTPEDWFEDETKHNDPNTKENESTQKSVSSIEPALRREIDELAELSPAYLTRGQARKISGR